MHWMAPYVGMKHSLGGRGPNGVDCWGLLQLVYRQEFKIEIPDFPEAGSISPFAFPDAALNEIKQTWRELEVPFEGCAVGLSQSQIIHHVGIYTEAGGGMILHCWDSQSAVVDTLPRIKIKGFRVIRYFKHCLWPT